MKSKNIWIRVLCVFLSIAIMSNSLAKDHHARRASSNPNPTQEDREGTLPILENHVQQDTAQTTEPTQSEQAQAIQDAKRDAEVHTNKAAWFLFGCTGVGLLFPYFYESSPPASALLGKSPEYVAYYTDTYKLETRDIQFRQAVTGGVVIGILWSGCCIINVVGTVAASN